MRRSDTLPTLGLLALLGIYGYAAAGENTIDVRHYDIEVQVLERKLEVTVDIEAQAEKPPKKWDLALARTMSVKTVDPVPFKVKDRAVVLDLSGVQPGNFHVRFKLEGTPYTKFSPARGGFVRTAITPDIAYVRSQYPWYPRNGDDAATYRVSVVAPEGWIVRTAGHQKGEWIFEQTRPCRRIGLVAAPYDRIELGPDMDAIVPRGEEEGVHRLLEATRRAVAHYAGRLGKLDLPRLTLVKMPDAYGPSSGYCEDGYILVGRRPFENEGDLPLVAHEVAHSWWGHEVGFSDFTAELLTSYVTLAFVEKELGQEAARRERQKAVRTVLDCAEAGKEISLLDLKGFGGSHDPQTYRAHAYDKAMMILVMIEGAIGKEKLDAILTGIVEEHRGEVCDYRQLRQVLMKRGGATARRVLTQWEEPGIPTLEVSYKSRKGKVKGTLSQTGTRRRFQMDVTIRAVCGEKHVDTIVKLRGKKASFSLKAPVDPESLVIDPEYRIVAKRTVLGATDPEKLFDEAFKAVSNPNQADQKVLEKAIADLRRVLAAGVHEDLCHVGMGRCLFRLGQLDEAEKELKEALRIGVSPFHRQWTHLRLGCIADLRKKRKKALKHYRDVVAIKSSAFSAQKAQRFLERPYRGYAKDG